MNPTMELPDPFWDLTGTGVCRLLCGMADAARALLLDIEVYCRRCGIAESSFGRRAVNDGKFVARLHGGKGITTTTLKRVRSFMGARPATSESTELSQIRPKPPALRVLDAYVVSRRRP